ncbi:MULTISPECIES: 5-dehydro-4-deoxy-D-glucuronate isomerase [Marinilabiliaceae]|uniref:4-deoxy-L-threo-5-hexosulose-uronate ketol-isomerase n=1 Tax=Plebeiibacterium marinum TaxID=2992111 RepID=A0AAE3MFK9_9BACT|nr:5-dehydro-4-deoxy-D-glucuronate isomerase [Plebeiobacterium marinum]MCU4164349.1 5-dehydro-4-deoxy-D-glucuronate isomerase [Marinilabiliaceae bacterium A049]MCW3806697.1 5-dehydro-4-deoxy-D-glucuronate isomerase [Plebeiobacterium marinum]
MNFKELFATDPQDFEGYNTQKIRDKFLLETILEDDEIYIVYSHNDRFIVGGAVPISKELKLETVDALKAEFFLARRELGVINVGKGTGVVSVDGTEYELKFKEALYIGSGNKEVIFKSSDKKTPARFYLNSAPAHASYPVKKITLDDAECIDLGSLEESNARRINKLIVNSNVQTCQLQMGMTELKPGSVWNTMPAHTHSRRMEAYFYFEVPEKQAVCHYMGKPDETRHIWMKNEQAVISPAWSIHSASGTSNYIFVWGMAGENLDYGDMDVHLPTDLK